MEQLPKKVYISIVLLNLFEGIIFFLAGVLCLLNTGAFGLGYVTGGLLFLFALADIYAAIGPNRKEIIHDAFEYQMLDKKIFCDEEENNQNEEVDGK